MNIYDEKAKRTKSVSAYVICIGTQLAGTITFCSTVSAVTCYLHIHGARMVKGIAKGGGYNREGASLGEAIRAIEKFKDDIPLTDGIIAYQVMSAAADYMESHGIEYFRQCKDSFFIHRAC